MAEPIHGAGRAGNGQPERWRQPRWKVFEFAKLATETGTIICVIKDLSLTGALISSEAVLSPGQDARFILENEFEIAATVIHNTGNLTGLRFNLDRDDTAVFARWLNALDKE